MTKVALIGLGKMGSELLTLLPEYDMACSLCCVRGAAHKGPFPILTSVQTLNPDMFDLAIDFSSSQGLVERMTFFARSKKPVVLGTTGWDADRENVLSLFKENKTSMVWGANFSLGMWIFRRALKALSKELRLFPEFDIGLFEAHHRAKKDAPSGTMIAIQEDVLAEFPEKKVVHSSEEGALPKDGLDVATLRVGSVPGYHMAWIDGPDESIQISHSVRNRKTFARGALEAATLLLKNPGVWHFHELMQRKEK
jgi:4-hydroxy-tetrahydrodipicolinate reductase